MKKKKTEEYFKSDVIQDFINCYKIYIEKFPDKEGMINRDFFQKNTKLPYKAYFKYFSNFSNFKKYCFKEMDINPEILNYQKNVKDLKQQNIILKKERDLLLSKTIDEDEILHLYKKQLNINYKYPIFNTKILKKSNKVAVLNLSDFHLGEVVKSKEVNFTNEFNKEICIKRLDLIFEKLIVYTKVMGITEIYLLLNGDLISGGIHTELIRNSDLNEIESVFYLQEYLIKKFLDLTKFFNKIDVEVIIGNHARILQGKPYFKEQVSMSYEYILGKQLKIYFDLLTDKKLNNKITINVPDSPFIVKQIKNLKFLVTHGQILTGAGSGGFLGLPAYSISMSSAKLYGVLHQIGIDTRIQFDHIICGHLHTTAKIPIFTGGFCFVGGCVIGTNEFSLMKMKSVAKKEQLLLIIDDEGIDGEINIKC